MRGNWPRERQQAFILGSGAFFTGLQHIKRCTTWTSRSDDGDNTHTHTKCQPRYQSTPSGFVSFLRVQDRSRCSRNAKSIDDLGK